MSLSEYERRILQQLERDLSVEDPALARELETGQARGRASRRWSLPAAAIIVGVVLLVLGLTAPLPLVGFLGFLLVSAGITGLLFRSGRSRTD